LFAGQPAEPLPQQLLSVASDLWHVLQQRNVHPYQRRLQQERYWHRPWVQATWREKHSLTRWLSQPSALAVHVRLSQSAALVAENLLVMAWVVVPVPVVAV
jgi:hypothetical protein